MLLNRLKDHAGRFRRYYNLGPAQAVNLPPRDIVALGIIAAILQAIYLAAIPLAFECDAAAYYAHAKALVGAGGVYSYYRPPIFSIFLLATGGIWPGTFAGIVLAHAAFGVASPLITYRALYGIGRIPALIGAGALIVSTIPFTAAKLVLAEQLYMFLILLAIFALARYQDHRDPRAIYAFLSFALSAMFTRWEGQFLLFFGCCAIMYLAWQSDRQLRHALAAVAIAIALIAAYSASRAMMARDLRLLGTLQNGTGIQVFHRVRTSFPDSVFRPSNGPATQRLRDLVENYARKVPDSYRLLKSPLNLLPYTSSKYGSVYEELFGRFEGSPDVLADNIFQAELASTTAQYTFYMATAVQQTIGLAAADRLFMAVTIEAFVKKPDLFRTAVDDSFTLLGFDTNVLRNIVFNTRGPGDPIIPFIRWGVFSYTDVGFDLGGCASAALPASMMNEYRFDQSLKVKSLSTLAVELAALGRNVVRPVCGVILVFGCWLIFFSRRRPFDLAVTATLGAMIFTTGIAVGGANHRYDYAIIPIAVLLATSIASEAVVRIRRRVERPPALS